MNWYKNLKLKTKFSLCFCIISVLIFILGTKGISNDYFTNDSYKKVILTNQDSVKKGISVINEVIDMRILAMNSASQISSETADSIKNKMETAYQDAKNTMEEYLKVIDNNHKDTTEKQLIEEILQLLNEYYTKYLDFVDATVQGDVVKVKQLDDELTNIGTSFFTKIYQTPIEAYNTLSQDINQVEKKSTSKNINLIIFFVFMQVIVIFIAIKLTIDIKNPIEKLKAIALNVAKGDLRESARTNNRDEIGELSNAVADMAETFQNIIADINQLSNKLDDGYVSHRIKTDKYQGVFKEATDAINQATNNLVKDSLYVVDKIREFGDGNFEVEVKEFKNEKVVIQEGIRTVQNALKNVSKDITNLIDAANEGNLEFRLDTSSYVGQWKEITNGLNEFVENVVSPIKETQNSLNQFALGNFEHRITNEYKGEFDNIKQTVNYMAETIGSYISEISTTLEQMANKNFDVAIEREYLGDFKVIQQSVNLIAENLNSLIKDIIHSAEKVSDGAKQISESSIALAEGATEQAGSVEQINSTVSLISKQSRENAQNSEKANELAIEAKESANQGSKQMNDMLSAMDEINVASSSISNIIKVIDDIAFQTNILALNAAVEAARAGEHGKGFAVVAEEVRNLAARSQEAAKETTELIETSVEKVSEGSKIANNTAEALVNIVDQIEKISTLINSCAISSKEQEKSIEEMTEGISQISTVTQNNTATSEESAAASEELANQAEIFYASVSDFKLKEE